MAVSQMGLQHAARTSESQGEVCGNAEWR